MLGLDDAGLSERVQVEDDDLLGIRDGDVCGAAVGRDHSLVRLSEPFAGNHELPENFPGGRMHLRHLVVGVADRDDRVVLSEYRTGGQDPEDTDHPEHGALLRAPMGRPSTSSILTPPLHILKDMACEIQPGGLLEVLEAR